ncbi:MAG: hypothetical protein P8X63_07095 [Desulfuromonadaceae bacterium]
MRWYRPGSAAAWNKRFSPCPAVADGVDTDGITSERRIPCQDEAGIKAPEGAKEWVGDRVREWDKKQVGEDDKAVPWPPDQQAYAYVPTVVTDNHTNGAALASICFAPNAERHWSDHKRL